MAEDYNATDARKAYTLRVIQLWLEAIDVSQAAQVFFLRGETENEITLEYVARLVRLWREFVPKVKSRAELKELEGKFMEFESYCNNPRSLLEEPDKIIMLEATVRDVLDKLGLTAIENLR